MAARTEEILLFSSLLSFSSIMMTGRTVHTCTTGIQSDVETRTVVGFSCQCRTRPTSRRDDIFHCGAHVLYLYYFVITLNYSVEGLGGLGH
mmetsp:Transcript_12390/g.22948  ORF Transcript_12390/g.22948 Transcript_12390/m.22948 type:complete len:91 (-) Transcript_12390:28-300(-)